MFFVCNNFALLSYGVIIDIWYIWGHLLTAPLKPPRHVRIVDVRATNVSVAWLPPDEASIISNVLGYKVCRVDGMLTLYGHVKTQCNDHYTAIRWLVHWLLMGGLLHKVQWGGVWVGCSSAQSPPRCTKCNSPPINGQCANFILSDVAL